MSYFWKSAFRVFIQALSNVSRPLLAEFIENLEEHDGNLSSFEKGLEIHAQVHNMPEILDRPLVPHSFSIMKPEYVQEFEQFFKDSDEIPRKSLLINGRPPYLYVLWLIKILGKKLV